MCACQRLHLKLTLFTATPPGSIIPLPAHDKRKTRFQITRFAGVLCMMHYSVDAYFFKHLSCWIDRTYRAILWNIAFIFPAWQSELFVEGCSESNAPYFFLGNYSECMKFTLRITGCFLYTLFFHVIYVYVFGLTPARNKGMYAFPVPVSFLIT